VEKDANENEYPQVEVLYTLLDIATSHEHKAYSWFSKRI